MAASSDFTVTSRRMIIYTGDWTFLIDNVSFQDKTLYVTFTQLILVFTNYTEYQNKRRLLISASPPNVAFIRNLTIIYQ